MVPANEYLGLPAGVAVTVSENDGHPPERSFVVPDTVMMSVDVSKVPEDVAVSPPVQLAVRLTPYTGADPV